MSSAEAKLFPQYMAGLSAAMGSFALGAVIGWCSPVELNIKHGELGFLVTESEFAWVGSLMTLGAACVCIPIGFVINAIGRKMTMVMLVPPFVLGWLLIVFAKTVEMLYVARFLLGMCGGAFCIIAPIYTTEIAETKIRGILGSLFQMLITMGVMYGFVMGSVTSVVMASVLCGIVPLIMGCLFLMLPESPAFLVHKGKIEQAEKAMQWLRGKYYDITSDIAELVVNDKHANDKRVPLGRALFKKTNVKALCISVSLMLFQQLSGINAIVFYSTSLFKDANPDFNETNSTILMGTMMVVTTFCALFLIDRAGRRILLMTSAFFMSVSSFGIGFYFIRKVQSEEAVQSITWLPVTCCCIFVVMFSFGFGAIPWLIMAEIFSEDLKGVCGSIAGTINWAMAFLVTNLYSLISNCIGVGETFCIFGFIALGAVFFVLFFVPETKNKTFLEIQDMLEGGGGGDANRHIL